MSKFVAVGAYVSDDAYAVIERLGEYDNYQGARDACTAFEDEHEKQNREVTVDIIEV